jgi:hypothetical protein
MSKSYRNIVPVKLGLYDVYCFKGAYSKDNNEITYHYQENDFIYRDFNFAIYRENLLIVDFNRAIVHIIEENIYIKSVKIGSEIDSDIFEYFSSPAYMAIDIWGNALQIYNIIDLYEAINSYPRINFVLETNSYLNTFTNKSIREDKVADLETDEDFEEYISQKRKIIPSDGDRMLYNKRTISSYSNILSNIQDENSVVVALDNVIEHTPSDFTVYARTNLGNIKDVEAYNNSLNNINQGIQDGLSKLARDEFEGEFYAIDSIVQKANTLLDLLNIKHSLKRDKCGKITSYICGYEKRVIHIGKIDRELREFINTLDEFELGRILELIFLNIIDEDYIEYIIDTISILTNIDLHNEIILEAF